MALDSYTNLQTAIGNWMARSDLSGQYDDFIDLSEALFRRSPQPLSSPTLGGIRADKASATGTMTAGTATLGLPADYLELDSFRLTGDNVADPEFVSVDELGRRKRSGTGRPRFFTIGDTVEFDIAPSSDFAYQLTYWPDFDALGAGQASNWVLANYPDCYLAACLHYASLYVMDEVRAQMWANKYKGAAHGANDAYKRGRYTQGPLMATVDHRTP